MEGYRAIIDVLFPPHCVACKRDGVWLCPDCLAGIEIVSHDPSAGQLEHLVALGYYHDPRLRAVIHGLKYRYATCLAGPIQEICRRARDERRDPWPWAGEESLAIQPVVATPERIRTRGFDQAELIANAFHKEIAPWATLCNLLQRASSISAQADLDVGPLRGANVAGSFRVRAQFIAPNPTDAPDPTAGTKGVMNHAPTLPHAVLLVDDVFTTGATMHDAGRALREAGVERVYGFVLAHALHSPNNSNA